MSPSAVRLHDFLHEYRDKIVERWLQRVRQISPARELSSFSLIDHVPLILDHVAAIIEVSHLGQTASTSEAPESHAIERLGRGFDLHEVIKEYTLLRQCILDVLEQETGSTVFIAELRRLEDAIEQCIAESASRFTSERERTLSALDNISMAAFGSSDPHSIIERLLRATQEAMEVVDTAAILLREGNVLRVRAAVGIEEEVLQSFSVRIGEGFAGRIAAEAQPVFVKHPAEDALVESDVLRKAQVRALYGVPLIADSEVIGVAHMGSRTADEYSEGDKLLFETMVNRATLVLQSSLLAARLQESELQLAAVLDVALDSVISMDRAGRVVGWNKAAERTFGYSRAQVIGADMADLIVPSRYRAAHRAGLSRYLTTREQQYLDRRIEIEALRSDQTEFPVELTITRLPGEPPLFTGFLRDITDEKLAKQERVRLIEEQARIAEAQSFLSESSKQLAETLDYEATLETVANLAVPKRADWCAVDVLQQGQLRRVSVAHVDPQKVKLVQEVARRYPIDPNAPRGSGHVVRTGRSEWLSDIPDTVLVEAAQDAEHLRTLRTLGLKSYISTPLSVHGKVLGAITFVSAESARSYNEADVPVVEEFALRVATALENAQLYEEAQAAVRAREDVLAVVSHDLRNPLGTISMSAKALEMTTPSQQDGTRQRRQIEIIQRSAERMGHLIDDLLDMASIQAQRLSLHIEAVQVLPLLCEVLETHKPAADEAGIVLRQNLAVEGLKVRCDAGRLIQALSNLLGNAVKFCTAGDEITLGASRHESEVIISVADTGPGISPKDLQDIFKPYWTAKRDGTSGTGLGLYITKGIIETHGGNLSVESEPGKGTTFFFAVPIDAKEAATA